jgi:hypothetical protein
VRSMQRSLLPGLFTLALLSASPAAGQPADVNVTLLSTPNPSQLGQPVTFQAGLDLVATGTVEFREGSQLLGTASVGHVVCPAPCPLVAAFFTTSSLTVGSHSVSAHYGGDASTNPAVSNTVVQVVGAAIPTLSGGAVAGFALLLALAGVLALRLAR